MQVGDLVLIDTQGKHPGWDGIGAVRRIYGTWNSIHVASAAQHGDIGGFYKGHVRELPTLPEGFEYTGEQRRPKTGEHFISLMRAKNGDLGDQPRLATGLPTQYADDNIIVRQVEPELNEEVDPLVQLDVTITIDGREYSDAEARQILRELDEALS